MPECARKSVSNDCCCFGARHDVRRGACRVLIVGLGLISDVLGKHYLVVHVANDIREELPERLVQTTGCVCKRAAEIHSSLKARAEVTSNRRIRCRGRRIVRGCPYCWSRKAGLCDLGQPLIEKEIGSGLVQTGNLAIEYHRIVRVDVCAKKLEVVAGDPVIRICCRA